MSWYDIVDYNVSVHPNKDVQVYLHIGGNMRFKIAYPGSDWNDKLEINRVTYEIEGDGIRKSDSDPQKCYVEKVTLTFSDPLKAQLMVNQIDKALQSNVFPSYNKDGGWVSIPTPRYSRKVEITKSLPN